MLKKVIMLFGKSPYPFLLALFFSGLFCLSAYRSEAAGTDQMIQFLKLSSAVFLLLFIAFSFLCDSVRRRLAHEQEFLPPGSGCGVFIWGVILYKEMMKIVFGVSITLGWLAGMLFVSNHFREQSILVPILIGIPISAVAFLPAYYFAAVLDQSTVP